MKAAGHLALPRFSSKAVQRLCERAMVRGITPRETERLDRLLAQNPADREAYTRLARLMRAMEGDPPLGAVQVDRVLDNVLAATASTPAPARLSWAWSMAPRLAPAMALCVLALVSALLLTLPVGSSSPEFAPRGAAVAAGADPDRILLRPFCIRNGIVHKGPSGNDQVQPDARCLMSDDLQLMVTHRLDYPHLLVFGQLIAPGKADKLVWYYPVPPTGESGKAPPGVEYAPLGQAIHLRVNHHPGRVRMVGVFSREPLSAEVLFHWMRGLGRDDSAAGLLRNLAGQRDLLVLERWVEIQPEVRP